MYLGRSRNHRVDRIIYILAEKVELDFRRDAYQIRHGIKPIWLSTKERTRKKLACVCMQRYSMHVTKI